MSRLGFIKRKQDLLSPEEILLDSKAEQSADIQLEKLERPLSPILTRFIFAIGILLTIILGGKAFDLQILHGQEYYHRAYENRIRYSIVNAPRGIIFDRFHKPLVLNAPSFSLEMVPIDMPSDIAQRESVIQTISKNFDISAEEIKKILDYSHNRYSLNPILLKPNLTLKEVRLFETLSLDKSGFEVTQDNSRYYPEKDIFAHVVGYVGRISSEDKDQYRDYPLSSLVGKSGLELEYEKQLHGREGKTLIEINAHNQKQYSLGSIPPQKGQDLVTTIDSGLQSVLYEALKRRMEQLGIKGAGGVALNPQTGEVLALVSLPSFDPNVMTRGTPSSLIRKYLTSSAHPLFNRIISGAYPPGSVIKPLMALAALKEHIIDPNYKLVTNGKLVVHNPYHPEQSYIFRDWQNNGIVDMRRAIAMSCNVYFWAIGGGWKNIKGLGLAKIRKYWDLFHLNKKTGIDLPGERNSVLPNQEWLRKVRPNDPVWKLGDTYNISIGEGGLALTPIQIAAYISTIASNGVLYQPHLLLNTKPVILDDLRNVIPAKDWQIVHEGMREVITSGTAKSLSVLPFDFAGKSGSPKFIHNGKVGYHALFAAYAPYKNPKIVLFVFAENPPQGHVVTLPVVKEVLNWYWENRIATH